ncbi:MAG: peptide/nickel transport system permease protein [Thermomicrobiales bacterium]|nr:peptide/nickel transport system permease protein [Thermomicrobiales bacterium]MEA2531771.1 peptide/nickel transport system permease protein [Thermomicrobiales bacterium]
MGAYLIRRALISIVTLVAISMVIFTILYLAPGDPLSGFANNPSVPAELRQRLRKQMGIDDPLPQQYTKWATQYIQGNWGVSYSSRSSVRDYVLGRLPVTIGIVGSAFLVGLLIAIPIGVISAIKQYSLFDQFATTFAFLGFSLPTFFTGILLIVIFSVKLNWLPFIYDSTVDGVWAHVKQAIMPVTVLGLAGAASLTRFVRASMLEVISQDYVRTARAKGLREQSVVILHAMRNAMIPVITIIALQVPEIFGGAIITEQIFRVPGIGRLLIDAISNKDVPVVMAVAFGISILVVVFNIIADVLYAVLDPRIKLS